MDSYISIGKVCTARKMLAEFTVYNKLLETHYQASKIHALTFLKENRQFSSEDYTADMIEKAFVLLDVVHFEKLFEFYTEHKHSFSNWTTPEWKTSQLLEELMFSARKTFYDRVISHMLNAPF